MNNFSITLKHGLSLLFLALLIVMPDISMTLQTQTSSFEIVLFRDKDSLTVYIPGNTAVSIRGLQFETADSSSRRFAYRLEEYSAFYGLNFDAVQAPICLRLLRQGVNLPYPTECMKFPSNQRLTQSLVDADIFGMILMLVKGFYSQLHVARSLQTYARRNRHVVRWLFHLRRIYLEPVMNFRY